MIDIIYEDKYIIIVNKKDKFLTIANDKDKFNNLYHLVSEYVKKKNEKNKIFIVHRLDYDTSGLVLFAKNEKIKAYFQDHWTDVKRKYIALVSGYVKKDHDILKHYLKETKTLLTYVAKSGKIALTEYQVLERKDNQTKLEINLLTGRKNQIRVQLKAIGNPIIGDSKYGGIKNKHMLLHAYYLEFSHPITKKIIKVESELPKYFYEK